MIGMSSPLKDTSNTLTGYPLKLVCAESQRNGKVLATIKHINTASSKVISIENLLKEDKLIESLSPYDCFMLSFIQNLEKSTHRIHYVNQQERMDKIPALLTISSIGYTPATGMQAELSIKGTKKKEFFPLDKIDEHKDLIQALSQKEAIYLGSLNLSNNKELLQQVTAKRQQSKTNPVYVLGNTTKLKFFTEFCCLYIVTLLVANFSRYNLLQLTYHLQTVCRYDLAQGF
ncbi:hypothetical protein [Piscirickettsia litoralis]|uniref:Uncharacterized protein n=1 Tax=Piscirickettsia litoralis TaxID=1891921 RepID=A0ABX3A6R2_9GAMM|nr:hypothetical protein [Piscirickettsia litoralis]ODN43328.1 hypothetical protein BGC07_10840 [Piscirickettsia litoralis]